MRVWRLHNPHAPQARARDYDPLDGQGAALHPGRWNEIGTRLLYTSPNPSLAVLETLNQFGERELLELDVPDETFEDATASAVVMPFFRGEDRQTQAFGSTWVRETRSLVLLVPSTASCNARKDVTPVEHNTLINPTHPGFAKVSKVRYTLDPRHAHG